MVAIGFLLVDESGCLVIYYARNRIGSVMAVPVDADHRHDCAAARSTPNGVMTHDRARKPVPVPEMQDIRAQIDALDKRLSRFWQSGKS